MPGRTQILVAFLFISLFCAADSEGLAGFTVPEYREKLNELLAATQKLDSSGAAIPETLQNLPSSWRVHTDQKDFDIPTEGLGKDVSDYERNRSITTASAIQVRIRNLRDDLNGFEASPPQETTSREQLMAILARPEFRDVRGPSFFDRLKQTLAGFLVRLLERLFSSSAIPTISQVFIYCLIGLAVLTLGYIVYRQIRSKERWENVVPADLPVSAKGWTVWLAEARAAAAQNNWREAIHLAYWAGISFLEHQGAWRPDRARTPREYLRLLSSSSQHREILAGLTRVFELAWYANRGADEAAFSETIEALERLGCRPS
jgi:hypothetical protein